MQRILPFLLVSILTFGVTFGATSAALARAARAEPVGTIETVDPSSSAVSVRNAQGTVRSEEVGATVEQGDHVLPKTAQTVTLRLKDGSEVTGAPGSDVAVSDYVPSRAGSVPHVELDQGSAHFNVTKTATGHTTFFIKTRSATIGVRGTEFIVDQRSNGYSTVHTLSGTVWMGKSEADSEARGKSVVVASGKTSYLHPSMASPSTPQIFNRKTYFSQLKKEYPGLMRQVRRVQIRRERDETSRPESGRRGDRLRQQQEQQEEQQAQRQRRPAPPPRR